MNKKIVPPSGEWEIVDVRDSRSFTVDYSVVEVRNNGKHEIAIAGSVNGITKKLIIRKTLCDIPIKENYLQSNEASLARTISIYAETFLAFNLKSMIELNSIEILDEATFWASRIFGQANDLRWRLREGQISRKENIDERKKLEDEKKKFMDGLLQSRRERIQLRLDYTGKKQLTNFFVRLPETYEELKNFIKDFEPTIKVAKKTTARKIDWKSMVRDAALPQNIMNLNSEAKFPDDLLMRLDDSINWSEELSVKVGKHGGESNASDIALEWACRLCSFHGYEPHSLNIRQLRKILKNARAKNRGTEAAESVP